MMGLDVTAFTGLTKIENPTVDEDGYADEGVQFSDNPDFPGRIDGIELRPSAYECEDSFSCWSGGYGRYNQWREELAKLAGYAPVAVDRFGTGRSEMRHDQGCWDAGQGPFYELICFSDCEGTIGPVVSAKIAKDFADFQERADKIDSDSFKNAYADWRKGFEMAAQNGAVKFH